MQVATLLPQLATLYKPQPLTVAQLSSSIEENEGSLSKSLFKLAHVAGSGAPAVVIPEKENVSVTH
jgi:hypothetical protein